MGKPAARIGDQTSHGSSLLGAPSTNVIVGGKPAWRMGDQHTCPIPNAPPPAGPGTPHGPGMTQVIPDGVGIVAINGKAAARVGDIVMEPGAVVPLPPPNPIVVGCPTVLIATLPGGGGGGGSGNADSYCAGDPVGVFDGTVLDSFTDFQFENFVPISLSRSYSSKASQQNSSFGFGWSHSHQHSLTRTPEGFQYRNGFASVDFASPESEPSILPDQGYALFAVDGRYSIYFKQIDRFLRFERSAADHEFLLSQIEDAYGNRLYFEYGISGNLVRLSDRARRTLSLEYEDSRVCRLILSAPSEPPRLIRSYHYDNRGDLRSVADPFGNLYSFEYSDHLLVAKTLPNGYRVFWEYDSQRRCTKTWTSDGRFSYQFDFLPDSRTIVTSANGQTETVQFEPDGTLIGSTDQLGVLPLTDKTDLVTQDGRVAMVIDPEGRTLRPDYDEAGDVQSLQLPSGALWQSIRNDQGAEVEFRSPEGRSVQYEYDERGRQIRITLPDGSWETWDWNDSDDVIAARRSDGSSCRFRHDGFGNITSIVWPDGTETRYSLDSLFRITEEQHPNGVGVRWRYNSLGSVAEVQSSDGNRTSFDRIGIGLISQLKSFSTGGAILEDSSFEYDATGETVAMRSSEGIVSIDRDVRSRVIGLTLSNGFKFDYQYDEENRLIRAESSLGPWMWSYDDSDRVESVESPGKFALAIERDQDGLVAAMEDEVSGQAIEVSRDKEGNVVADRTEAAAVSYPMTPGHKVDSVFLDGAEHSRFSWNGEALTQVEAFGAAVHLEASKPGVTDFVFPNGLRQRFHFDSSGRLNQEELVARGTRHVLSRRAYLYDRSNRITSVIGVKTRELPYQADGALLDTERPDDLCTYDARGRLVERRTAEGATRYVYDAHDRLKCIILPDGRKVRYVYDLIGRRIEKKTASEVIRFVWAGQTLIRESHYDASGNRLRKEIRYAHLAGYACPVIREDIDFEAGPDDPVIKRYFYHLDRLGVPRAVSDDAGDIVWESDDDLWRGVGETKGDLYQPFRFEGHYHDGESGLHYVLARYYDPTLRQFLTPSLSDELAGLKAKQYCYGDPVNYVDATGDVPVAGSIGWISSSLQSAFTTAVQTGASNGLTGSELGKFVDKEMGKTINNVNDELKNMGSRNRVMNQSQRFSPFDPKDPKSGWGRGKPPYPPSKIADALIVEVACDFDKGTPTYKDGKKGAIKKIHRGYDWSVGQPSNLSNDRQEYANLFTQGKTRNFKMWDATHRTFRAILSRAGVI